jgi:hypothetical protein
MHLFARHPTFLAALLIGVDSLGPAAMAQSATGAAKNGPGPLVCAGEGQGDKKTKKLKADCEADPYFIFSVALLERPSQCQVSWQESEGQDFGSIKYGFPDGSLLSIESLPPETSLVEVKTMKATLDEQAARAFLQKTTAKNGFHIAWTSSPRIESDQRTGITRKTYWDPEEGINAGADLIYRDGKLIGIGFHSAL